MVMRACRWIAAGAIAVIPLAVQAQSKPDCDYARCALRIVPRLSGLDVVRGDDNEHAGSLNFLWPNGTVIRAFQGDADATLHGRSSVRKRRVAAALTDAGALLIGAAMFRGATVKGDSRPSVAVAGAGAAALAISVPLQFAADEQLSKAVHRFNRRFAR
jgi:hypothetical protein